MNCPRCGQPLVPGASFCSRCGQAIAQAPGPRRDNPTGPTPSMPPGGVPQGVYQQPRKSNALLIGGGAILGIALLLLLLKISGVFAAPQEAPNSVALQKITEANPTMPPDVLAWLKHLEKVEAEKKELSIKEQAEFSVFATKLSVEGAAISSENPVDNPIPDTGQSPDLATASKFHDLQPEYEALIKEFESLPPPAECKSIADDYHRALSEIPGMVGDLMSILNQNQGDLSSALAKMNQMKDKSYSAIDKPFEQADERVQVLCDKYHKSKWFNIGDVGGSVFGRVSSGR